MAPTAARVLSLLAAFCATLGFGATSAGAAAPASVPLDPFPVSAPSPLGNSRPPDFVDEDETVRVRVDPSGRVLGLVDDALIKIRGSGDYVIQLPARVTQVANLGGESPPGIQDGHVSFLGHAFGQQQLGVEATLANPEAVSLPLAVEVTYSAGGRPIRAADMGSARGPVTVSVLVRNLTATPRQFVHASAAPAPLATVLEALRQVPGAYIPELDLAQQFPIPSSLPAVATGPPDSRQVYVPLALTITVRLPAEVTVSAATGADATTDARGTRLTWSRRLPAGVDGAANDSIAFTMTGPHPRVPAIDVRADPLPLPASYFSPPGGATWAAYLARRPDRTAETLLAEEGMASVHRIGELAQPLGRPGPGPVKVKYDFILESGSAPVTPPVPAPVRGQPLVILLAVGAGLMALTYAGRAWARH